MRRIVSLFFVLFFISCQRQDAKTTLVLDWLPNPNHIPLYVGQEKGLFAKHGIDLEILKSNDNGSSMGHLSFGRADLVVTYMPSFAKAEMHGAKAFLVAKLIDEPLDGILFYQDGTIHSPKDLSKRVFGYAYNNSFSNLIYLLKENEIAPKKMVQCSFDLVGMLLTHQVDAVYGAYFTIEGEQLKEKGFPLGIFTLEQLGFPHYHELVIAGNEENEPFAAALQEAIDFCKEHPEEAFEIYERLFPEKSKETLMWEKRSWARTVPLLPKDQVIDTALIPTLKEWYASHS